MPRTRVVLYREADGTIPLLDWLDSLPPKVREKCLFRIQRLAELGHELRRPEADLLRMGFTSSASFSWTEYRCSTSSLEGSSL